MRFGNRRNKRPETRKFQSRSLRERTRRPWRLNQRLETRKLDFVCDWGSLERIWRRSWSERREIGSERSIERSKKRVLLGWGLGLEREWSFTAKTTLLRDFLLLSQRSDQLDGVCVFFNGETGFGFSGEKDIVVCVVSNPKTSLFRI